ncbi:alpha-mannosidase [Listeria monocytogenes]|uniref:Alpha-mannosidase n=1 Tax=Listeria monocytogenes TaxID=1639 RepID=A0AAN2Z7J5_LISMN|nr:glycoside hydrolase family 38 C-terminal domain-containing protein [Listeria monocytogenes]EAF4506448.1 alpha-mannosidase [Listeria monocytogenes serotype 1/2a]EAC2634577.1 alpha-mannosidase [Listeria monocytogenes]EAC4329644.1 alpha-mannosidase [Listeria monocytogenes]EAC6063095.1 alpha-mannosidase [Listeria monocytogenes]EAC8998550.1 alpha-mannosidase [Listeria monocytogenes]
MKKNKIVHVVAHSHWDHEWYFTMEDSNILLIENLDYLLNVLETKDSFASYSFDGQMSVIERYLDIRPENKARVQKLIQDRRLFVGPWYTQTDSLLVKTEAVIRNLLYGYKMGEEFGHSMSIGYSPDIFGQHAYLPAIYKSFNMEHSIFQRGVYNDQVQEDLNFHWTSPDNKSIPTNNIFFGYGPGKFLSSEKSYVETRLLPILDRLAEMNTHTDVLLLPAGGDQVLVRENFPEIVAELNEMDLGYTFILSDYEAFMNDAWTSTFPNEITGELLACQKSRIHHTCRSERYDIKRLNYLVENRLVNILEPLATMANKFGIKYPKPWLDIIWKKLFDSHAHNGIGASNSDDANHDIVVRLTSALRMTDGLINLLKKQITKAVSQEMGDENIALLFNTNPVPEERTAKLTLFTPEKSFQLFSGDAEVTFSVVHQEKLDGGRKVIVTAKGEKEVAVPDYYRTEIYLKSGLIPALGYKTLQVKAVTTEMDQLISISKQTIENEKIIVQFENGKINLLNKEQQIIINDLIRFENVADAGDSFDFSPLEGDQAIYIETSELLTVEKNHLYSKMMLKHTAVVPKDLEARAQKTSTETFEILTEIELFDGEEFVRVRHTIDNKVKDHRIRALIKTNVAEPKYSYADQGYSLMKRSVTNPYLANWREDKFVEAPVPIFPVENIVAVSEEDATLALLVGGIKEYEILPKTAEIALTLFRSNGLLGKDDLMWRPGRASGINNKVVPTPDGQMLEEMIFEYAVYVQPEKLNEQTLYAQSNIFEGHTETYHLQNLNTFEERLERFEVDYPIDRLPAQNSIFELDNPNVFMSTCKKSWDGTGTIIRLFNPSDKEETVRWTTNASSFEVSLAEEKIAELKENTICIPKKGFATILLEGE